MNVTMLRTTGLSCALVISTSAFAQAVDESALEALDKNTPVTAPVVSEPLGAVELRSAMRRISMSPSDAEALADAGKASLALGDANAALNFFTRANALRPGNNRFVSGLATATVRTENPFEALKLFDDAVRFGASERSIAADRALAYDLLGNFGRAQQDYKLARTVSTSDDLIIRQAVSLSLAGQKEEADAMLLPLLQKNSPIGWRARAFMLAARGDLRESTKVAQGFMDSGSAQRIERFFRLMPSLTGAQQAAAIHLGHFPSSQYIGRDSEQIRRVAANTPQTAIPGSQSRLIPSGDPLGTKTAKPRDSKIAQKTSSKLDRKAQERAEVQAAVANIPEALKLPKTDTSRLGTALARNTVQEAQSARITSVNANALPVPETARPLVSAPLPRPASTLTPTPFPAQSSNASVAVQAAVKATVPSVSPMPREAVPATSLDVQRPALAVMGPSDTQKIAAVSSSTVGLAAVPVAAVPTPTPTPSAVPAASVRFDLGKIVGAIEIPESERASLVPVDLKKLKPVLPKAAAALSVKTAKVDPKIAAKAKAEKDNPARYWAQIAAGNADALGFDFRKFAKKYPELFKGRNPFTTQWGKTDRLLIGPFSDIKAVNKWVGDYKKAGGDSFMWKSEIGIPVTPLKVK